MRKASFAAALVLVVLAMAGGASAFEGKKVQYDFIADGKRLDIKEKGFSIEPPAGWEVFTTHPGLTLLMQTPHDKKIKYQRTIQVAALNGPRYMDSVTAKEYEGYISENFSGASKNIEDFRVRNHLSIEMADGRPALLFYTEYKVNGLQLMQAHILISNDKKHFLMTFTDVAEHFENDDSSQFLTEAWDALTSVKLKGSAPTRFFESVVIYGVAGGLLLLCLIFFLVRHFSSGAKFKRHQDGHGLEDVELTQPDEKFVTHSSHPGVTADEGLEVDPGEDEAV